MPHSLNSRPLTPALLLVGAVLCAGCAKRQRTLEEIDLERRTLPGLYITEKSRTHVIAPRNKGIFVDEATGELAYPAYACQNPDCPGRKGDEPYLFIHGDPALKAGDNNAVVRGPPVHTGQPSPVCPACLAERDLKNETPQQKMQYLMWARPYLLPESAARAKELEAEYQQVFAQTRRRVTAE